MRVLNQIHKGLGGGWLWCRRSDVPSSNVWGCWYAGRTLLCCFSEDILCLDHSPKMMFAQVEVGALTLLEDRKLMSGDENGCLIFLILEICKPFVWAHIYRPMLCKRFFAIWKRPMTLSVSIQKKLFLFPSLFNSSLDYVFPLKNNVLGESMMFYLHAHPTRPAMYRSLLYACLHTRS